MSRSRKKASEEPTTPVGADTDLFAGDAPIEMPEDAPIEMPEDNGTDTRLDPEEPAPPVETSSRYRPGCLGRVATAWGTILWVMDTDMDGLLAGIRTISVITILTILALGGGFVMGQKTGRDRAVEKACKVECRKDDANHWTWDRTRGCVCLIEQRK